MADANAAGGSTTGTTPLAGGFSSFFFGLLAPESPGVVMPTLNDTDVSAPTGEVVTAEGNLVNLTTLGLTLGPVGENGERIYGYSLRPLPAEDQAAVPVISAPSADLVGYGVPIESAGHPAVSDEQPGGINIAESAVPIVTDQSTQLAAESKVPGIEIIKTEGEPPSDLPVVFGDKQGGGITVAESAEPIVLEPLIPPDISGTGIVDTEEQQHSEEETVATRRVGYGLRPSHMHSRHMDEAAVVEIAASGVTRHSIPGIEQLIVPPASIADYAARQNVIPASAAEQIIHADTPLTIANNGSVVVPPEVEVLGQYGEKQGLTADELVKLFPDVKVESLTIAPEEKVGTPAPKPVHTPMSAREFVDSLFKTVTPKTDTYVTGKSSQISQSSPTLQSPQVPANARPTVVQPDTFVEPRPAGTFTPTTPTADSPAKAQPDFGDLSHYRQTIAPSDVQYSVKKSEMKNITRILTHETDGKSVAILGSSDSQPTAELKAGGRETVSPIRYTVEPDSLPRSGKMPSEIRLKLQPAELGTIRLQLRTVGQHLTARVVVQSEGAKAAVDGSLSQLQRQMNEVGIVINRFEVNVGQTASSSMLNPDAQNQRRRYQFKPKTNRRYERAAKIGPMSGFNGPAIAGVTAHTAGEQSLNLVA